MKLIYHSPKPFNEAMEYVLIAMALIPLWACVMCAGIALYLLTL